MSCLCRDDRDADERPAMKVEMPRLGRRNLESPTQLGHNRPYDGPLLLQRVHITEQQVELGRAYVRGFSLNSKVSMTSSTEMSL